MDTEPLDKLLREACAAGGPSARRATSARAVARARV